MGQNICHWDPFFIPASRWIYGLVGMYQPNVMYVFNFSYIGIQQQYKLCIILTLFSYDKQTVVLQLIGASCS